MDEVPNAAEPARWHVIEGGPASCGSPCGSSHREHAASAAAGYTGVYAAEGHTGANAAKGRTGAYAVARRLPPQLIIIDIDDPAGGGPRLSALERRAVIEVARRGIAIAVATAYTPEEALRAFEDLEIARPTVMPLAPQTGSAATPNPIDAAAQMAHMVRTARVTLPRVAVIAATPLDLPLMLEAGRALALAGAGRQCCAAADARFPARAHGGLAQALRFLIRARD